MAMHLARHPEDQIGYVGIVDSPSFVKFGNQQMAKPCKKAKLVSREFIDLKPEEVKERKRRIGTKVRTLSVWRRYPCCCTACMEMKWNDCSSKDVVGEMEVVVKPTQKLYG